MVADSAVWRTVVDMVVVGVVGWWFCRVEKGVLYEAGRSFGQ